MELVSSFLSILFVSSVIGGISSSVFLKPISPTIDNAALIPTITAKRFNSSLVTLSFVRGKQIDHCSILVNGSKLGGSTAFKIGDVIELKTAVKSVIEVYSNDRLVFFGII